jgi:phosphate-selective porin O/P
MPFSIRRALGVAVMTAGAGAASLAAQAPKIDVQGRIQLQYRSSSGDSTLNGGVGYNTNSVNNYFEIRRARFQTNVRFGDNIYVVIQPSFEMGALRMRDAYVRVGFARNVFVVAGQEKSPFQRYELISANNLPSIDRGLRILGFSGREGLNDLLLQNGYISQDLGAGIEIESNDHRYFAKGVVQGGSRESAVDVNNAKSFFGRVTATALLNKDKQPMLQVGASFGSRDRAICSNCPAGALPAAPTFYPDSSKRTSAFGLDAEWGGFRPGFHVIVDFATGDNVPIVQGAAAAQLRVNTGRNTANLRNSADSNVVTFMGVSVIAAYRILTKGADTRVIKAIEPSLRFDYLDPNTSASNDQGILITPVLNLYFANSVELRAGIDFYMYKNAAGVSKSVREIKFSWQANF